MKITALGAKETRAALGDVAAEARELGRMHPEIKVTVDRSGLNYLSSVLGILSSSLSKSLGAIPGIGGGLAKLPTTIQIGLVAAALAALPFLAQAAAGAITLGLGGALAGLGIYGAVASASLGKVRVTVLQLAAAQKEVAAAQDKLAAAQKSGKDDTGQLDRAYAGLASAQDHLAKVQAAWAAQQLPAAVARMHQAFSTLSSDAQDSLRQIGAPFVPVLTQLAKIADVVLKDLTPAFVAAEKVIAPAFQAMGTTLAKSFGSSQVVTAVKALGQAFAGLLKAFTPAIPGIVTSIADGFTNLFRAVARNPKAFADMAAGLFHLIGVLLDVLAWLTNVADYIEHHWKEALTGAAAVVIDHWRGLASFFESWGQRIRREFDHVTQTVMTWAHDLVRWFDDARHGAFVLEAGIGAAMAAGIAHVVRFGERVASVITAVIRWFAALPGRIVAAVGNLGSILFNAGRAVIDGLWNGLKSAWSAVTGWLSSIGGWISSLKGPLDKDLVLLRPHGRAIMTGLAMGMSDGLPLVQAQIARTTGTISGGMYGYGGGGTLRIQWVGGPPGALEQALWTWFRERIRVTGGGGPQSVQRALGVVWR